MKGQKCSRVSLVDFMALHSNRVHVLALAVATAACLLRVPALPARAQSSSREKKKPVSLSLKLQREVRFEHPLLFPPDGAWLLERGIAMHPDGKRAVVLLPTERKTELQARPKSGVSERSFMLAWVDLNSGQVSASRELSFAENTGFGFSMSRLGDFLCVIADQKVMILDETLSIADWTHAELDSPQGEKRIATSCKFVPEATAVLVRYASVLGSVAPWDLKSSLLEWNWKNRTAAVFHCEEYISDAVPLGENRTIIYRRLPNWVSRFRLEERELRQENILAGTNSKGFLSARLVLAIRSIIRVDRESVLAGDESRPELLPERFHDTWGTWGPGVVVRYRPNPGIADIIMTGRVLVWDRGLARRGVEIRLRGQALAWPLCVAHDDAWFLVRAVDFAYIEANHTTSWHSNQFVIFSLDGSKRRLYMSEKFGSDEAITGFALSRDDKTLLVSTSSRLLIYEVEAIPST